jgi:hypothetical protein
LPHYWLKQNFSLKDLNYDPSQTAMDKKEIEKPAGALTPDVSLPSDLVKITFRLKNQD